MKWFFLVVLQFAVSCAGAAPADGLISAPPLPTQGMTGTQQGQVELPTQSPSSTTPAPASIDQVPQLQPSNATDPPPPTTTHPHYRFCMIEQGFNFVGNDIGTSAAPQARDCCDICYATLNCRAFSWSPSNGGTCFLKRGRGRVVTDPNYQSALVYTEGYQPTIPVYSNINIVGNDISKRLGPSPSSCITYCRMTVGCRAFSFTHHDGGTCWFKSQVGRTVVKNSVTSGPVYPDPIYPSIAEEPNNFFLGNDIGSSASSSVRGCQGVCTRTTGCRAYTWTNYNGGTCWLKNLKQDTVAPITNIVSVQMWANPPPPSCSLQLDVNYINNDIGNVRSSDPYDCCSICMKTSGCGAFSWSDYNGGTCWLKSKKEYMIYSEGVKSAVV